MANVRGIPNTPAEPQYAEEPSGFRNRAERQKIRTENTALKQGHAKAIEEANRTKAFFDNAINSTHLKKRKGNVTALAAAAEVRCDWHLAAPYDNPSEYIADLWADGFIDDKKAHGLLSTLKTDGEVKKSGADSPAQFLSDERQKLHISREEFHMMMAWERASEKTQSTEELAALRQTVIQQLLGARPDMDKGEAALQAVEIVREIRDPFAHEMAKLAEQQPEKAASVDIGELTAVKSGGFADREAARAAARVEDKSPQR